ncbi:Citrate lyase subunit beta [Usitatibacter rugosus]|uniref:Citrate lyase subunit beta n=1 Tax=Usitatibacter rugosus TaxID=2732067 RepID=A0A6M4GYD8_9PROT|nr:CoA ester lyase [Usitatibacter rugosus]QJR12035.1 Citrate lyase subunit beta [Usitatibacter rugosus]
MPQRQRRATLFVGALALEALPAALASGADLVCIDLEDAVPPGRKDEAREKMLVHLGGVTVPPAVQLIVRVNAVGTPEGDADVRDVLARAPTVGALLIPKVESADEVRSVARSADATRSTVELYAIIETALGLEGAASIARADPRLKALFFGGFDLSTALGCEMAWEPLLYARSRVVHAAAIRGLEVLDSPFPDVDDLAALLENCSRVRALGMTGKAAKHASQVKTILNAFTPTPGEIAKARKIVAMFREDPTRPLVYEGKLVELPTIKRMERLAALD